MDLQSLFRATIAFCLALFLTLMSGGIVPMVSLNATPAISPTSTDIDTWRENAQHYERLGDRLNQAAALSNLSLSYQQVGDWKAAQRAIAQALQILRALSDTEMGKGRSVVYAQALDIQGHLYLAQGQAQTALTTWETAETLYRQFGDSEGLAFNRLNQAQALQALGFFPKAAQQVLQALGVPEASDDWRQALEKIQNPNRLFHAKAMRSLSQILEGLGQLADANKVIQQAAAILETPKTLEEQQEISAILLSKANLQRATAATLRDMQPATQFEEITSCKYYENPNNNPDKNPGPETDLPGYRSASPVKTLQRSPYEVATSAVHDYQRAIESAKPSSTVIHLQAQINQLGLYRELGQEPEALSLLPSITQQIAQLSQPHSHHTILSAQVNLARSLTCFSRNMMPVATIAQQLKQVLEQSKALQDQRMESEILGIWGHLYERTQDWSNAKKVTQQALNLAQTLNAPDIVYKWQWQMGRILKEFPETRQQAAQYYRDAVKTLDVLRQDLSSTDKAVQFSFRDDAAPVYRQLVDLLLTTSGTPTELEPVLEEARDSIDALQLAELSDFLGCNVTQLVKVDREVKTHEQNTGFIYPIILPNRLEVLFKLPGQSTWHHHSVNISAAVVTNKIRTFHRSLVQGTPNLEDSQEIYEWLIQPLSLDKAPGVIDTLVFILDGEFRNIPMAALYDGKKGRYLIDEYPLAVLPGSRLFDLTPPKSNNLNILAAGISQAMNGVETENFNSLPNVETLELKSIAELKGIARKKLLLNQHFTKENLQAAVNSGEYSIVHLATHGKFSSDPEQTYILIYKEGQPPGALLRAREFDRLLRVANTSQSNAIQLLVLSACETASGDGRATLGLAGLAVRAGAQSTIASLWKIEDESTSVLMKTFYEYLQQGKGKAKALQLAQIDLKKDRTYQSAKTWAPYVLIGNWF